MIIFLFMKVLAAAIAYNEEAKIGSVIDRFPPGVVSEILVVDDGSTDGTRAEVLKRGASCLSHPERRGAGAAIRTAVGHAREQGCSVLVIMAGNDKDRPPEIPRLLKPVREDGAAIVQGSRFLPGGVYGAMPLYRIAATRWVHPLLFWLATGRKMTDTTNGFRAIRMDLFDDKRIAWEDPALGRYELEPYLLAQAVRLGYKVLEAPVTKIYPPRSLGFTKMTPLVDWWRISKPLLRFAWLRLLGR